MARLFLIALFFLPFMSQAAFWDDAGQSEFFKKVNERYIPNIPTEFFEGEETKSASTSALLSASISTFTSQWEAAKRDAKEKAGIDLIKFFRWLAGSLAKLFLWLPPVFFGGAPPRFFRVPPPRG